MEDEETGAELRIISASFADPYLLVLRDDSSVTLLQADGNGDIEEIEAEGLKSTRWLSSCLYKPPSADGNAVAFLLNDEGGLHVC